VLDLPRFTDEVAASLPSRLTLPPEFRTTLEWMELHGYVHTFNRGSGRYASLYPASIEGTGTSLVSIQACDREHVRAWVRGDADGLERLAPIIRTGGDGSYAALWLDNDGRQRFVHLGSGSGSTWLGVICDSPVDMLRLMAIGYDELCWTEHFHVPAEQAYLEASGFLREEPYTGPVEFRAFVETTFGVTGPATASEIVKSTPSMDAAASDDPFWKWIRGFDK
jgi:hypothetical protein